MEVMQEAEVCDLNLPTVETKTTLLTEVLQPISKGSEPLLPFNETLSQTS